MRTIAEGHVRRVRPFEIDYAVGAHVVCACFVHRHVLQPLKILEQLSAVRYTPSGRALVISV